MIKITISTQDKTLSALIRGDEYVNPNLHLSPIPDQLAKFRDRPIEVRGCDGYFASSISFMIDHLDALATSIIAAWLYDLLKSKKAIIHIDDTSSLGSLEAIKKALEASQLKQKEFKQQSGSDGKI